MGRPRARDIGIGIGALTPGAANAITDVPGVKVGHVSLVEGEGPLVPGEGPIRTGVTAILPHDGNLFTNKVCAAVHVINAFGKSVGLPQVAELGNIETPILLTNTLNVWSVADALVDFVSERNPGVGSFNPIVGECNDGYLNDVLGRHVRPSHVREALEGASGGTVAEGNVGAGVGMSGFGWKAGIGTSSRRVAGDLAGGTVGILVLTNTGAPSQLRIDGAPVGRILTPESHAASGDGSIMIVLATDAPLTARQLGRVARRCAFGLARTGATASHGSGDFVIAFTTTCRITAPGQAAAEVDSAVPEPQLSHLFEAAVDATEEAIVNSLLQADTLVGRDGNIRSGIPIETLRRILTDHRTIPT